MHIDAPTVRAFLEALAADHRRLVTIDADHLLAVERLLAAAVTEDWSNDTTAAAIASLYARDRETWEQLQRLIADYLTWQLERPAPEPRRSPARKVALALLAVATVTWVAWIVVSDASPVEPTPEVDPALFASETVEPARDAPQTTPSAPQTTPSAPQTTPRAPQTTPSEPPVSDDEPSPPTDLEQPRLLPDGSVEYRLPLDLPTVSLRPVFGVMPLWFMLITTLLAVFGVAALLAPRRARTRFEAQKAEAITRLRQAMQLRRATPRTRAPVPYHIERSPPFFSQLALLDDAATILARIGMRVHGRELDIERSLAGTLVRGGRPSPVMREIVLPHELLVLVDVEAGDHPFLDRVTQVLAHWRGLGVLFRRFDFARQPDVGLREHMTRRPVEFSSLARLTSGTPVLLFSRGIALLDTPWLHEAVVAWPQRVFVDLDPRGPKRLDRLLRRDRERLRAAGFERVPFTPAGLVYAASVLAGRPPARAVPEIPLRSLDAVRDAIDSWLAVAACVPDPTWAALEAFRRQFPELAQALPDPAYVQRALERAGHDPLKDAGQRLDLDPKLVQELQAKQIDKDRAAGIPREQQLITRAHRMLLEQLRLAAPAPDSPEYPMWSLKCARHEAALVPAKADELFAPFLVHALRPEMLAMVGDMKALAQEIGEAVPRLPSIDAESWVDQDEEIADERRALVPRANLRPSFVSSLVGLVIAGLAAAGGWAVAVGAHDVETPIGIVPADLKLQLPEIEPSVGPEVAPNVAQTPGGACDFSTPPARARAPTGELSDEGTGSSCRVVMTALDDTQTPMRLVGLTGGEFTMGGNGHADEQPRHRVAVSRFAMCETEVSVAQYFEVTGKRPSNCQVSCLDDDPVHDVSWEDAVRFLNALTRRENALHNGVPLTECYDESKLAWDRSCTGFRLPTEAEWEYAARAGSIGHFSFGDGDACKYGHVGGCEPILVISVGDRRPNAWGLFGIHGNVWEWAFDVYDAGFYTRSPSVDPDNGNDKATDADGAIHRVRRGGSFYWGPSFAWSSNRYWYRPRDRYWDVGFRCALGPRP